MLAPPFLPLKTVSLVIGLMGWMAANSPAIAGAPDAPGVLRVPVVFTEGHRTESVDRGRPVVLIAAALGVPPEVFREAFTQVRPAAGGVPPEAGQVRENKAALMRALAQYGVTNERLDEVSNYYRYVRGRGELWPAQVATANALISGGAIIGFEVISGGSGYTCPPTVNVASFGEIATKVGLSYGKSMPSNGSVATVELASQ